MNEKQTVQVSLTPAEAVVLTNLLMKFQGDESFQGLHDAEQRAFRRLYDALDLSLHQYEGSLTAAQNLEWAFNEVWNGEWSLEEKLSSVAADLITDKPYKPFRQRLAQCKFGEWQSVATLCEGMEELPRYAAEVFEEVGNEFVVIRLRWPWLYQNDAEFMGLFYCEHEFWSTIAYYNGAVLD